MATAKTAGCPNAELTTYLAGLKEVRVTVNTAAIPVVDTKPGSSADNIVAHFAVNYHDEAQALGVDLNELYAALKADGEDNPPEWDIEGRQVNVYQYV